MNTNWTGSCMLTSCTIFSAGSKFWPISKLYKVACSYSSCLFLCALAIPDCFSTSTLQFEHDYSQTLGVQFLSNVAWTHYTYWSHPSLHTFDIATISILYYKAISEIPTVTKECYSTVFIIQIQFTILISIRPHVTQTTSKNVTLPISLLYSDVA